MFCTLPEECPRSRPPVWRATQSPCYASAATTSWCHGLDFCQFSDRMRPARALPQTGDRHRPTALSSVYANFVHLTPNFCIRNFGESVSVASSWLRESQASINRRHAEHAGRHLYHDNDVQPRRRVLQKKTQVRHTQLRAPIVRVQSVREFCEGPDALAWIVASPGMDPVVVLHCPSTVAARANIFGSARPSRCTRRNRRAYDESTTSTGYGESPTSLIMCLRLMAAVCDKPLIRDMQAFDPAG